MALVSSLGYVTAQEADSIKVYSIDGIEVVATRATAAEPVVYSEVSDKTIEKYNYGLDIPSILSITPSLVSSNETGIGLGGTSVRLRGSDATRLNVTINGVAMNDPDSHAMYWYDTPDLISTVGNIQVQRGAGVSTNGSGSFGGGISLTTAPGSTEMGGDVQLTYGSFNTNKQAFHFSSGLIRKHWLIDLRLTHISSDGYIDRARTDMKSYMFQTGYYSPNTVIKFVSFGGKTKTYLTYNGVTKEDMELYGRRYHDSGQYETSDGPFILADGTHVNYYNDQTDNYLQINNQLIINHRISDNWKMNLTGFYTYGYGFYKQYKDDAWLSGYNNLVTTWDQADLIRRKNMRNNRGGLNGTFIYTADKIKLYLGGSYSYYGGPHWGTIDWIDGMDSSLYKGFWWYENKSQKHDANLFAKTLWEPVRGLHIFADLQWRYVGYKADGTNDNYNWDTSEMQPINVNKKYNFFNPRAGITYSRNGHTLMASVALAHKEPTRSDFTDRYQFSKIQDEPKAERMIDAELGYRFSNRIVDFGATLYYMQYKNQLVHTGLVNDGGDNLNINVENSFRRGIELELTVRPVKWFSFSANTTLSQNRIRDYSEIIDGITVEKPLTTISFSPSVIANTFFNFHTHGFEAILHTQYVSKQYMTNGEYEDLTLPRYCVSDLNLGYTLKTNKIKSVRFGILINNLFNAKYCSAGYGGSYLMGDTIDTRASWAYYFPQATTNVLANVTVRF